MRTKYYCIAGVFAFVTALYLLATFSEPREATVGPSILMADETYSMDCGRYVLVECYNETLRNVIETKYDTYYRHEAINEAEGFPSRGNRYYYRKAKFQQIKL